MAFSGSSLLRVVVLDDHAVVCHWPGQRLGRQGCDTSAHYNAAAIAVGANAGAPRFAGKGQDPDELIAVIRTVADDCIYVEPEMAADIAMSSNEISDYLGEAAPTEHGRTSPRIREVPRCCFEGLPVSQTAAKFSRNVNIISSQKQAAFRKLSIRTDNDLSNIRHRLERS